MSPEQAAGSSEWATPQSDIFSLGVMLYQALTGELPFKSKVDADLLRQIQKRTPATPRSLSSSISDPLERVCMKALEKRPADRYSTADDMARDLRAALGVSVGFGSTVSRGGSSIDLPPVAGKTRGSVLPWSVASGVIAMAAMLLIAFWLAPRQGPPAISGDEPGGAPVVTPDDGKKRNDQPPVLPVQEVQLALQVHLPTPGPMTLTDKTRSLKPADKFRVTAETPAATYLYAIWYGADDSATVIASSDKSRTLLQSPPVSNSNLWPALGAHGEGYHMVLACSCPSPLTAEQLDKLKSAKWRTAENQGERYAYSFNQAGYPAVSSEPKYLTRGGARDITLKAPSPPAESPLGELDALLQSDLGANYQAVLFSVSE
ncbi:MAG: hypothetical protein KDA37_01010, partial [Planctomycetales bacterium]|nr:hypothetical protein [Planctomycetales bacterium]